MPSQIEAQLTDEEFSELDSFLLASDEGADRLTVDEAHGYLTALTVGPEMTSSDEWLEAVWGTPLFADEASGARMRGYLLRMQDEIATALNSGEVFEPMMLEEIDGDEVIESFEGWCFGFMLGVASQSDHWEELPKAEQTLLAPIAKLALLHDDEEEHEMDDEEYDAWIEMLPGSVVGLHNYWRHRQH